MSSSHQDITDAEKDILIRIRDISALRGTGSMRIVRTFYGDNSDEAFDEMIESCEFDGQYEVFNNPELYDEGSKDGLESLHDILTLLPQIIDGSPYFHVNYAEKMVEAKEEAEKTGLPKFPSEEFDELIDRLQCAAQWDHVLIYDKHAHDNHGSLLMVYLDNLGRVLRYFRLEGYEELTEVMGLWIGIFTSHDEGSFMWINAESGEDWKADQLDKRWGEVEALETLLE